MCNVQAMKWAWLKELESDAVKTEPTRLVTANSLVYLMHTHITLSLYSHPSFMCTARAQKMRV